MMPFMGEYRVQPLGFTSLPHPNMDGVLRIEPSLPAAKGYSSSMSDSCRDLFSPFLLLLSPATWLLSAVMSTWLISIFIGTDWDCSHYGVDVPLAILSLSLKADAVSHRQGIIWGLTSLDLTPTLQKGTYPSLETGPSLDLPWIQGQIGPWMNANFVLVVTYLLLLPACLLSPWASLTCLFSSSSPAFFSGGA